MVVSRLRTLSFSVELYGCVGHGLNGATTRDLGKVSLFLVIKPTDDFSRLARKSLSGTGSGLGFWKDRWLQGMVRANMAPGLFALARRKNLSVKDALVRESLDIFFLSFEFS